MDNVNFSIKLDIEDHTKETLEELEEAITAALEECGLAAEGYAQRLCPVDTGLLHNSITHALDGGNVSINSYSNNDGTVSGYYTGIMPKAPTGQHIMYVGTNVEYAPYVELGTSRTKKQAFIQPALTNNVQTYSDILKRWLSK